MDSSEQLTQHGVNCSTISVFHLSHFPRSISEGWWVTFCNGKGLQGHFKSFVGHEHTQSHWYYDKTINLAKKPNLRALWAIDGSHENHIAPGNEGTHHRSLGVACWPANVGMLQAQSSEQQNL